ncbi:MAG: ATP-binding protein [Bacteroidetes bacterium]|nr:ATP-binding protein [Bacteroidota bacterium]
METNASFHTLLREIDWLNEIINQVIGVYFQQENFDGQWYDIAPPDLIEDETPYGQMVQQWELTRYDRLAMALALVPHLKPEVLDIFFGKNQLYDRGFTEFGGVIDPGHSGFIPTGQTLLFLTSSIDPAQRLDTLKVLSRENILMKEQILVLGNTESHIPESNGTLTMTNHWLHYLITGEHLAIEQSASFPARRISTRMEWEDIVMEDYVMDQILEIQSWLTHGQTIMEDWGLGKMIKPGYRALFYGPPGTGKTLTATLLGKTTQRDVYKVDLSMIVSKYIGETEKNLAKIFDIAQHKDWILFFDEADALFGKRTEANSSNDRHANQQTAYLLQRIEDFPGVIILASNLKSNMDEAFTRRFQSMIHFPMPDVTSRYQLWENAFSGVCTLDPEIDLWQIAEDHELAGGAIINVLRHCALSAIERGSNIVNKEELMNGLKREFKKENKTLTRL